MRKSSKPFINQFCYWMIRAICIWAVVYFPSARADCIWSDRSTVGFQTKNWTTPTLPTGSTKFEIVTITVTANMKNCPSSGGAYSFGPVMNLFSDRTRNVFQSVSSEFNNGIFKGKYQSRFPFSIESTASFSNLQPSSCKPTITATTLPAGNTPGIQLANNPSSPCTSFTYIGKIVVVQTADVIWGDANSKSCTDPNECNLIYWIAAQLWAGMISSLNSGGGTNVFTIVPDGSRLEVWAKFPPSPPPPPAPTKKCVVQLRSAPSRSRL